MPAALYTHQLTFADFFCSGVLALPAAVATLGDNPDNVLGPAVCTVVAMGAIYAFFFRLVGQVCDWTNASSYKQAWQETVGENSQVVATVVLLKTLLSCLAYSMILADSFQALALAVGFAEATRTQALGCISLFALLPLCLQKDLNALAPYSLLGLVGMGFTSVAMMIRCFDGTYADQGMFSLAPPCFGDCGPELSGVMLVCTLATAFVAHYNAPRFKAELKDNSMDRFNAVTGISYSISSLLFVLVAFSGFLTFGSSTHGNILTNYSPFDPLMIASRGTVAFSLLFTYPLPFVGLRDGALDVMEIPKEDRTDTLQATLSVGLLAIITVAAYYIHDLAMLLSVGGGTFSTAVAAVFPTLMFSSAVKKYGNANHLLEAKIANILMVFCVAVGGTGVYYSIHG
jgi:amino acid permease